MENKVVRKPAVAGSFYPEDPVTLSKSIAGLFAEAEKKEVTGDVVGIVSPHAGYIYSGNVAAVGYKLLVGHSYDVVAVISPSHAAYFEGVSAYPGDSYSTPLGEVEVATGLVEEISANSKTVFSDTIGHDVDSLRGEHALEVQLPFLQIVMPKFKLLPLIMGDQKYSNCEALADDLFRVLKGIRALIIASTDLSHFHSSRDADRLDSIFIKEFESYRPEALSKLLNERACEACGSGPVISTMLYAKHLGQPKAKALKYADSGVISGDFSSVVGYLSGVITI